MVWLSLKGNLFFSKVLLIYKDHRVYLDRLVIVVIRGIVVNQVIWYVDLFFIFQIRNMFLFRVLMVYKELKEKKVKLVQLDHK